MRHFVAHGFECVFSMPDPFYSPVCIWVPLTDEGVRVQLRTLDQVLACEHKSRLTVSVKDKIAGITRNEDTMRGGLEMLARNEAARAGGNAVAAESEPTDGRQVFLVYDCPLG
jgi:hypothetical protein